MSRRPFAPTAGHLPPEPLFAHLLARLSEPERHALNVAVGEADKRDDTLYLVGGSVRDLLQGGPAIDLDLVVEGDAIGLAKAIAAAIGASVVAHPRFGTATLRLEGLTIDIARARAETYARPGALPTVQPATLEEDMARRDFTVNAMALVLSGPSVGELLDPHGGRADLDACRLRVLHPHSFQDDATRILRAIRYEARLGLRLARETLVLLQRDVSFLGTISGARLRREIFALARLHGAPVALRRAHHLGALAGIHRALSWDAHRSRALRRLIEWRLASDESRLCLLAATAPARDHGAIAARLALGRAGARALRDHARLKGERRLKSARIANSALAAVLAPYSVPALAAYGALAGEQMRARVLWYLRRGRHVHPALDGHDLIALGVPEGPKVGALLARLRDARLDGAVATREDEVALVRAALSGARHTAGAVA